MPPCLDTSMCSDTPMLPICSNTPICPQCSPVDLHVLGVSSCHWGMQGALLLFGHLHVFGCLPMCPTPPCIYMVPCMSVCSRGYCMCYGGTSHMLGGWGFSTSVRLFMSVSTSMGCPLCFILYLSCSSLCLKSLLPLL